MLHLASASAVVVTSSLYTAILAYSVAGDWRPAIADDLAPAQGQAESDLPGKHDKPVASVVAAFEGVISHW